MGEIVSEVKRRYSNGEYEQCEYKHRRAAKWIKEIDLQTDIYLLKALRAQQTISDITVHAKMIYRNLHPCYISEDGLHLMLRKNSNAEYRIKNNIDLQKSVLNINSTVADYYHFPDSGEEILVKTAVGSPGFIELIMPYVPASVITVVCVIRAIIGKTTTKDGEINTGLMAILTKGSELLNDHVDRKKSAAETKKIEAEADYTKALTRKVNAEAQSIEIENDKALKAVDALNQESKIINAAVVQSGLSLDRMLEEVS